MKAAFKEESGYSLVEVLASIVILSLAILPMFAMFDAGLNAATTSSNYDNARALANAELEKVEALAYEDAVTAHQPANDGGSAVSCDEGVFDCEVETNYVDTADYTHDSGSTGMMVVEVRVEWDDNKSFSTTGLKARGGDGE